MAKPLEGAAAYTGSSACLVHPTETHGEQGTLTLSWQKQWKEKGEPWLGPGQASLSPLLLSCPPTGADSPCQSLLYQQTRREETHLSSATPPTPTLPGTKACSRKTEVMAGDPDHQYGGLFSVLAGSPLHLQVEQRASTCTGPAPAVAQWAPCSPLPQLARPRACRVGSLSDPPARFPLPPRVHCPHSLGSTSGVVRADVLFGCLKLVPVGLVTSNSCPISEGSPESPVPKVPPVFTSVPLICHPG